MITIRGTETGKGDGATFSENIAGIASQIRNTWKTADNIALDAAEATAPWDGEEADDMKWLPAEIVAERNVVYDEAMRRAGAKFVSGKTANGYVYAYRVRGIVPTSTTGFLLIINERSGDVAVHEGSDADLDAQWQLIGFAPPTNDA